MKKIIISAISILIISSVCKSQISYDNCGTVMQDTTQLLPAYLSEDWLSVRNVEFAVLYVDFPDGRVNGTLQPFFDYQLAEVADTDAVAEVGTIVNQNGDTVLKCAKYTYFDRWNMFFDSLGNYIYDAHPDWQSHKDSAWGSMKEYWREVTNNKLNVVPARIRQNPNGDPRLNSGIINNFTEIEPGRYIIKSIRMRKPKYGANGSGYFPKYPFTHAEGYSSIWGNGNGDAFQILDSLRSADPQQYPFDHRQFMAQGGKIIIIIAGGGSGTGGMTSIGASSIIARGRTYPMVNRPDIYYSNLNWLNKSTIDAFGISAHEIGHALFGWYHTEAGRYDLMTGTTVWNVNCPPHPNPIYKMKQGWLDPIALEHSQDIDSLGAIENTHQCGVLTIFGKPSGSPNWSSGECYVLENRRRIGFDRKLIDTSFFTPNPDFRDFKGGLLIWHYSPYFQINGYTLFSGVDATIRLRTPEASDTNLANDRTGRVQHFFAYLPGQPTTYYHFPEARTFHVGGGFATGLEISNISQTGDLIGMSINYNLKEPTVYSGVIYNRSLSNHVTEFSGTIFYHEYDKYGYFRIREGSVVEGIPNQNFGSAPAGGARFQYNSFEIAGSLNLPITFKGAGMDSMNTFKIAGIRMMNLNKFESVDSLHLKFVRFQNLFNSTPEYAQLLLERNLNDLPPLLIINSSNIPRIDIRCHPFRELTFGRSDLQDAMLFLNGGTYQFKDKLCLFNSLITQENNSLPIDMLFSEPESQLSALNTTIQARLDTVFFGNGATLKAHESQFLFQNFGTTLSRGFEFSNSGHDSIVNCTFSNAKTALSFVNDEQHKFTNRIIKNCTFNIPTGGDYKGIYGENNYSILVEGNRFNMPASPGGSPFYTGLYLKNVTPSSPPEATGEEGASATPYSLNIVNNTFRNGSSGIVLANYTSNLLPYYIKGNRFDSLDAHAATVNIIGMKITGTIKDNVLSSSQSPIGIHLINSSPNLLNNIVNARDVALHLVGSSYANLAPNIYNNQSYWSGGRNTLSSFLYDNIQLAYMGNAYTDYGRNKFTVSNDFAYHIYGWLDTNVLRYHSRDNCWYTSEAAKIYLRHPGATMPVPSTTYNYGINCNSSPGPISWEVDNLGNGIFDSVLVSEDVSDSLPTEEEILIAQCEHYLNEMQMFGEAMISLKYYIDDYPDGEYTNDALMNLYTAYLYLDTSANQNNRNILFSNLINYCEDKVASNLYDTQFEYLAGDVIAMCNFELDNYDDAMNWYEFIALFYPDPDIRLSASWNYAEIEALIGSGSGGGEAEIENGKLKIESVKGRASTEHIEFLEELEIEKLHEEIVDDPVMRKLFRKFELQNKKMSEIDMQATNGSKQHEAESEMQNSKLSEADMLIYDKAKKNIFSAGTLQGKEAESDRMRDIVLMLPGARSLGKIVPSNVLPAEFALRQNYPNPFNPMTKISFDLPQDSRVNLIVYDLLGREVTMLVNNEFKVAGKYTYDFNGASLSSGVYFYRLETEGFTNTKRMMLIK